MRKSDDIKNLLIKYINRDCSQQEINAIVKYFKQSENLSDVPTLEEVSKIIVTFPDMDGNVAERIFSRIIESEKLKQLKTKRKIQYWQFAAASIFIGVLISFYFLQDFNLKTATESTPIIVNNKIEGGSDKATLTLEDGSIVVLEKGNVYKTQSANSDGRQIFYKDKRSKSTKIVYNYLTIPRGGQFFVKLADGTQVWLNSESQLKYPTNFIDGRTRQVELVYGEAYFDVSPSTMHNGSTFKVLNQSQEIEVLGTEFNLKAYKEDRDIYTTLVEGKVVLSTNQSNQTLKPKQQAILNLDDNSTTIIKVDLYPEISWKDGVFSFRKKQLSDIMKVLSRWYDIEVQFSNEELKSKGFNGVLGRDQDIEEILKTIKSFGTIENYEINDRKIILK